MVFTDNCGFCSSKGQTKLKGAKTSAKAHCICIAPLIFHPFSWGHLLHPRVFLLKFWLSSTSTHPITRYCSHVHKIRTIITLGSLRQVFLASGNSLNPRTPTWAISAVLLRSESKRVIWNARTPPRSRVYIYTLRARTVSTFYFYDGKSLWHFLENGICQT